MKSKRKTTIQSRFTPVPYGRARIVPEMRIAAKWLGEAGFDTGVVAEIEVSKDQLIIRRVKTKSE